MPWEKITIQISDEWLKEAVIGEFSGDGIVGVWERPLNDDSELVLYFEGGDSPPLADARIGRIFERNGYPSPTVTHGVEEKSDWSREWRRGFTSFQVGRRFLVVPSWEEAAVAAGDAADWPKIVLGIDPGLAFGTGTHETTRTMLEMLEEMAPADGPVLDVGTGSGILAIAARKLGAEPVVGCEVDADAGRVASANFDRNSTSVALFLGSVDAVRSGSIRVALANLTLEAIIRILPDVTRVLEPQGRALFSGILVSQANRLKEVLARASYVVDEETTCGEWATFRVRRDGN